MATPDLAKRKTQVNDALEVSIQVGLAALLVISCLLILRPFIPLLLWGIIIAIASHPTYIKLERRFKGRRIWAAVVWSLVLLAAREDGYRNLMRLSSMARISSRIASIASQKRSISALVSDSVGSIISVPATGQLIVGG